MLAKRHGINPKTVAKWHKRTSVADERSGRKEPKSTVLSVEEEAVIVAFRRHLAETVPYKIHIVLTDNGPHFTETTGAGWTPGDIEPMQAEGMPFRCHAFEAASADLDIEHRLKKPEHPWTNGQVERWNRTINDATVRRDH